MGVIDDPFAERMLPASWGWHASTRALRLPGFGALGRTPSFAYLAGRTRFYDDFVTDALDRDVSQVVVLGAGYDSRAWRFARAGVTFFEVDLSVTQAAKRSRAPAGGPVYVPADVTDSSMPDKLTSAGFQPGQPSAFTAEGLAMYLTDAQVAQLLRTLALLGGIESRLAINFGVGFEREGSRGGRLGRRAMAKGGEAYRSRLPLADAPDFMSETGWSVDQTLTGQQLRDRYLSDTEFAAVNVTTTGFAVEATLR